MGQTSQRNVKQDVNVNGNRNFVLVVAGDFLIKAGKLVGWGGGATGVVLVAKLFIGMVQFDLPRFTGDGAQSIKTAICVDGQPSFSRHRSGTCSGHGGVREWLYPASHPIWSGGSRSILASNVN